LGGIERKVSKRHVATIREDSGLRSGCSSSALSRVRRSAAVMLAAGAVLLSKNAFAYRTIADLSDFPDEQRVRWESGRFEFEIYEGVPGWLTPAALVETSERAFDAWGGVDCASVIAPYNGLSSFRAEAGDGRNTIEIVTNGWEAMGLEAAAAGAADVQLAQNGDGVWQIVEADIRINAEHHEWSLADAPEDGRRSLLTTLRHEAGHALGLLHPCEDDGDDGAPLCDELPAAAEEAIMFPFYEPVQSELLADDQAGICHLYPNCGVSGCAEGFECTEDGCRQRCGEAQCQVGEHCFEGSCLSSEECELAGCFVTTPEWIVECVVTDACPDGLCLENGTCAVVCTADADCASGAVCLFSDNPDEPGYCDASPLRALGERCEESNQCAEGECLAGARGQPICTRSCEDGERACPSGWTCGDVDGRSVCVPPRSPRGCSVPAPGGGAPQHWLLAAVPFLLIGFWKRRARSVKDSRKLRAQGFRVEDGCE
jgi:hypothetical protein